MGQIMRRQRWLIALIALAAGFAASAPALAAGDLVDVIVLGASSDDAADAVHAAGGDVRVDLPYLGGVAASVAPAAYAGLAERGDLMVAPDEQLTVAALEPAPEPEPDPELADLIDLVTSDSQLGAVSPPGHWSPASGDGVGVALLDTGVADLPEFEDRLIHALDLSGEGDGLDNNGHGTFMAGLIAADGSAGDEAEPQFGIAPGAHIVSVKLSGRDGSTSLSRVLEGIGWVIDNQDEHGIRVVNLSLGVQMNRAPQADPLAIAVEAAWRSGLTVVTASGNNGAGVVTSPGRSALVLTVGATDTAGTATTTDDTVPDFSGSGKVAGVERPDVVAPGTSVVSLRAPGSKIEQDFPEGHVGEQQMRGTGTSMSTAIAAGAVAVLAENRPFASPDELKGALTSTAVPVTGSNAGAIDLAAADIAEADPDWVQGRGNGAAGVPWDRDGVETRWQRARWLDGGWERARWLDEDWARARWLDEDWARARWLDDSWERARWLEDEWARARWLDEGWARARWLDDSWERARWLEVSYARARWLDASWQRARWLNVDFSRARWLSFEGPDLTLASTVDAPATFDPARTARR
ncbi:MAG: S8 family serine peptidase [Nitriliruptor sp.]|uniref:S8 family serine peptidase n=1 Tax=Nitriliruptor sp. TaxID=2448056 RepID=UPI0034A0901A